MFATTLLTIYGVDSCRNYYPWMEEIGQEEDHIMYHTAFGGEHQRPSVDFQSFCMFLKHQTYENRNILCIYIYSMIRIHIFTLAFNWAYGFDIYHQIYIHTIFIYIYIHTYMYRHIHIYIYIYIASWFPPMCFQDLVYPWLTMMFL